MSLMGKNYIALPMSDSRDWIMSFTPWVTHGIELCAFVFCPKYAQRMIERERFLPQKEIVNYDYDSYLHSSGVTNYPVLFTSMVKKKKKQKKTFPACRQKNLYIGRQLCPL